MLTDIEMPPLPELPGVSRRLLTTKHKRTVDMENQTVTLDVSVLHFKPVTVDHTETDDEGNEKTVNRTEELPFAYIGKGDGLRRFRLVASNRTLVDKRTGLNAIPDGTNDGYLMPEFNYLLWMLDQGATEAQLVQAICARNVARNNFDSSVYELI